MGELFQQLKDKHLVRTAVVYLGGAWLLLEATGFFVDVYALSRSILDIVVLLVLLGFPAALVISWFHGEKGRQDVARAEAALLLTLAVLAAVGTYRITTARELLPANSVAENRVSSDPAAGRPVSEELDDRAIAVLPFTNATGLDSLAWVGSGVSDMLTTSLASIGDMRVVSPQRLFELLRSAGRGETDVIPDDVAMQVAGEAGARRMVRGSVLGTLDDLVLDVQLIDVADGTVVAGDRMRGEDVFAMSDSLAAWVSGTLAMGTGTRLAVGPPARPPLALSGDPERLKEYAIELRSAWRAEGVEADYRVADLLDEWEGREAEVRAALERIVEIAPADARALQGLVRVTAEQNDAVALDTLVPRYLSVAEDPVRARMTVALAYERMGRMEEARDAYRALLREGLGGTAPLDRIVRSYLKEDRPAAAREELAALRPDDPELAARARLLEADSYAWAGDFDTALAGYAEAEATGTPRIRAAALESQLSIRWLLGRDDGASRINRSVWTLLELGRHQEALNVIEGAEHLYVRDSDRLPPVDVHVLLYARGRALELMGADRAAEAAYARLLSDWGDVIHRLPRLSDAAERLSTLRSG